MRYTLDNGTLHIVRAITADGMTITNPSDEQIDQFHAGWPLRYTTQPSYDPTTQYLVLNWIQETDSIHQTWMVQTKTAAMLIADIDQQVNAINADFARLESTPVLYPTDERYYLLGWAREYYAPLLLKSDVEYPTPVADVTLTTQTKTRAELQALYDYLIAEGAAKTAQTNAKLAELYARKQALETSQEAQEVSE